jgi:uncharacterized protein YraI
MEEREWLKIWRQIPFTTKVYFVILLMLVVVLTTLLFLDAEVSSDWFYADDDPTANPPVIVTQSKQADGSEASPSVAFLTAVRNADIFSGPGLDYHYIGILEADQTAEIIGRSEDNLWWVIKVPYIESGRGWVLATLVSAHNVDGVPIVPEDEAQPEDNDILFVPTVTAVANVNVRNGPGMGYNKIGVLANGQVAEVLGKSQDGLWWLIKSPSDESNQGWVSVDYVIPRNTSGVPVVELRPEDGVIIVPTPVEGAPRLEALAMVNIRSGPGIEFRSLARLEPGQVAEVVGRSANGSWYAIRLEGVEGGFGWVALVYVRAVNVGSLPIIR